MANNNAPGLSIATALFFSWSLLTFCVRAWVKLRRSERWGWDDSTITAALAFALFHLISIFWAVHDGYGISAESLGDSVRNGVEKAIYSSQFFYIVSIGLSKISTGLFIGHLTRHGPQVKRAYALSAICGLWTIASIFVIALRGDLSQPWTAPDGSDIMFVRWTIVEVTGLVVELALWGLSINIIWNLSMALSKRCTILAIFGCRLLLIPLVTLRLYWLSTPRNPDPQTPSMMTGIITEAVMQFAFISASVTCLKPFLKPFHSSYVVSSVANSGTGWRSGASANPKDPYYVLSAIQEADKDGTVVSHVQSKEVGPPTKKETGNARKSFRPDNFDQEATISASSRKSSSDDDSDNMIIRKTESWSVRFEEGGPQSPEENRKIISVQPTIKE